MLNIPDLTWGNVSSSGKDKTEGELSFGHSHSPMELSDSQIHLHPSPRDRFAEQLSPIVPEGDTGGLDHLAVQAQQISEGESDGSASDKDADGIRIPSEVYGASDDETVPRNFGGDRSPHTEAMIIEPLPSQNNSVLQGNSSSE